MKLVSHLRRVILITSFLIACNTSFCQNSSSGKAFSDGIWTLLGASNGVELYVTYVKYTTPGVTNRFSITVYGKVVNTTTNIMNSPMTYGVFFRYTNLSNVLTSASFGLPQNLKPGQTIVKALTVATNLFEIRFGEDLINSLDFVRVQ